MQLTARPQRSVSFEKMEGHVVGQPVEVLAPPSNHQAFPTKVGNPRNQRRGEILWWLLQEGGLEG